MESTDPIQSRMASLVASLSVLLPLVTSIDFCAHEPHAKDVEALAADVFRAHEYIALKAEQGGGGGGCHAMLAGAGFGDNALLAHAKRQEGLADGVVDLVCAGVVEVFALEINFGSAEMLRKPAGEIETGGAADEIAEIIIEFALEIWVGFCLGIFRFELVESGDKSFGNENAAVGAEMAGGIGQYWGEAAWVMNCYGRGGKVWRQWSG